MSIRATPSGASLARSFPHRGAAASRRTREDDGLGPARGIMLGLGLSAMIWTGLGALFLI